MFDLICRSFFIVTQSQCEKMKVLLIILVITSQAFAALKLFEMQKWDNCPGKRQIDIFVEVNNTVPVPNKMFFSGHLDVLEKVTGPLEISFETNRCEHNMEKCEKFSAFKVRIPYLNVIKYFF